MTRGCAADMVISPNFRDGWPLVRIIHPNNLPTLSNVQHLDVRDNEQRLAPSIGLDLALSFPNLRTVVWNFGDCYHSHDKEPEFDDSDEEEPDLNPLLPPEYAQAKEPRAPRVARAEFAKSLMLTPFHRFNSADMYFYHESYSFDQRYPAPSIVPHGLSHDTFSTALRTFSENLTSLTLEAYVDSTLF